ncbi:hypothetical protein [Microbacterium sp. E-13]|uniref:hypothetical protein n=1 Tax=Microbacterium sp. E-13 TaxID=3404048 RepID=UPI003CF76F87
MSAEQTTDAFAAPTERTDLALDASYVAKERHDESDAVDPTYARALQPFRETDRHALDERQAWADGTEALEAVCCCWQPAGDWPCVLPRHHAGEHAHPTVVHVI